MAREIFVKFNYTGSEDGLPLVAKFEIPDGLHFTPQGIVLKAESADELGKMAKEYIKRLKSGEFIAVVREDVRRPETVYI